MPLPLRYSAGHLARRRTRTGLTVGVIALVVLATTLFLGLVSSLRRTLASTGHERNLIVLRKGSTNDGSSILSLASWQNVRFFDGIAQDAAGQPLISPELVVQPFVRTRSGGRENVLVRGVEPVALQVHEEVRVVEGRMFEPSRGEAIVGRGVAGRYEGASLGQDLEFGRSTWKVVGIFESGGTSFESEIWVDVRELARDARRPEAFAFSGFRIRVAPGADLDALARRIGDDPRYALEAEPETAYYADQASSANTLYALVVGLAVLAGLGATFGATNALFASVESRIAEIGTLRAMGFSRASILSAFLIESLLLAGAGCLAGGVLAWALAGALSRALGGVAFGAVTFTTSVIELRVGPGDLVWAFALALLIGLAGGVFPARRAARLSPVDALRRA